MAARERYTTADRARIAADHARTLPDRLRHLGTHTFSEEQIEIESRIFLREHHFQVSETHRLNQQILHTVGETILEEQRDPLSHITNLPRSLGDICDGLASTDKKNHRKAVEALQSEQGETLIHALQEQHNPSLEPTIAALLEARLAYRIGSQNEQIRTQAIRQLHTQEGESLRERIIQQTRSNMDHILRDDQGERRTYTHEEVVFLLPDVLANVYAASIATLGFAPHDEQLYGVIGIVDGPGKRGTVIKEDTGEGKTFVAAASAIVQALHNSGVHVATSNDYLAEEGAKVAAKLASACGLSVGLILFTPPEKQTVVNDVEVQRQKIAQDGNSQLVNALHRRTAYAADITYGQKQEYETDYDKDQLITNVNQLRQTRLISTESHEQRVDTSWKIEDAYAIVDEIDYVLADQATKPTSIEAQVGVGEAEVIHGVRYSQQELRMLADIVAVRLGRAGLVQVEHGRALVKQEGGYDEVERQLRKETITEFLPNGATITKGPLLTANETYFGGKIDEQGKTDIPDTVKALEDASPALAGIFEHYLYQALQAEFIEVENGPYWIVRNPQTMTAEVHVLNENRRDDALSRYQNGLHAALEAKHHRIEQESHTGYSVAIRPETKVLSSTTTQRYWNKYKGLSGMSGTVNEQMPKDAPVKIERPLSQEFWDLYQDDSHNGLRIINIPRHSPANRVDHIEAVGYRTYQESMQALADYIGSFYGAEHHDLIAGFNTPESVDKRQQQQGRPFLLGYYSRENMEQMQSIIEQQPWFQEYNATYPDTPITIRLLSAQEVQALLDASPEELEERIVQQAGHDHSITIANLAGRGTDVPLTELARRLGGLYPILGEPLDNIRQERQFRGRGGRQADPTETRSFASIDARLFSEIHGPEWVQRNQERLTITDHEQLQATVDYIGQVLAGSAEDITPLEREQAERGILIGINNQFRPSQIEELKKLLEKQEWFIAYNKDHADTPFTIRILTQKEVEQANAELSPLSENTATITIVGVPGNTTGAGLDELAESLGGLLAVFGGRTTKALVRDASEMREQILRVQATLSNWQSADRYALHRDYQVIGEQLDEFYESRREIVFAENQDENVRQIVRSYVRSLLIGDLEKQKGLFGPPDENDRSVSTRSMIEEQSDEFIRQLSEIIPLDEEQVERLTEYATTESQRALIDFATDIVMETYTTLQQHREESAQTTLSSSPNLPENSDEIPAIDPQTYVRLAILANFDEEMSGYLTQIADLHEEFMHRANLGEKQPEDLFRIAAYEVYRGFKPHMQRQMLQSIFSNFGFDAFVRHRIMPFVYQIATEPEEGITIFEHTPPTDNLTFIVNTSISAQADVTQGVQIINPGSVYLIASDDEESN